jgi:hypothetical protein
MSLKITTTFTARRPTLIRVWRTDGTRLTSNWVPTLAPNTDTNAERSPRL